MKTQDYIVLADGWIAGAWRAKGSTVALTEAAAQYENVKLDDEAKVALVGSLDDPTVKSTGLADKEKAAQKTRSRSKK